MNPPRLTLTDLAAGLDDLGDRYHALGVFADDVVEVQQVERGQSPAGLAPLDAEGRRFAYAHQDTTLLLEVGGGRGQEARAQQGVCASRRLGDGEGRRDAQGRQAQTSGPP